MKKIAIYGKGGIGKSTTVSNLSAALTQLGLKVMQIGCDPKADSTVTLNGGHRIPTVLDTLRKNTSPQLSDLVKEGYNGILCVEAGGPTPGIGCAGRGIIAAFEKLNDLLAFETLKPDVVLYDVLGDVVCGGFAMPMREGYAEEVIIISSGEMMSLYAAHNIAQAVRNFSGRRYATLKGMILNRRAIPDEAMIVHKALFEIGTEMIGDIPRSSLIQDAEALGKTVCEAFPDSPLAELYRDIAKNLIVDIELLPSKEVMNA
ncbi:MAG: AAA family ATPase [Burkholderiales bacterium]|jgi:nitrogenase iron protein NifH|nr:AAA family ATPase [Burkholderiales bacterium]